MKIEPNNDPEQCRQPAPEHGDRRAHDRARAGDAGEMVAEDDLFSGGHVVDVVSQFNCSVDHRLRVQPKIRRASQRP